MARQDALLEQSRVVQALQNRCVSEIGRFRRRRVRTMLRTVCAKLATYQNFYTSHLIIHSLASRATVSNASRLLRPNEVPFRELLAHRGRIVRARTAVINELHAVYGKRSLEVPRALWHRHQPAPWRPDELGGYGPRLVDEDVALLKALNEQISGLDKALKGVAQEDPEATRLMTHPGVGALTAVAVRAWVGDIHRFASAKHLVSYFGLAPRVRQRADTERHGHISKEGNRMVRTLVLQAALSAVRHSGGPVRRHYLGVLKRRGKKIGRIAAANKLLGVLFQMMKQGLTYEELHQRGGSTQ